jgi:hypothetical protein
MPSAWPLCLLSTWDYRREPLAPAQARSLREGLANTLPGLALNPLLPK